jgi:hypothetical protein
MRTSSQEEVFEALIRLRLLLPVNLKYVPKNAIGAFACRDPFKSLRPDVSKHTWISVPHPKPEFNVEVERALSSLP